MTKAHFIIAALLGVMGVFPSETNAAADDADTEAVDNTPKTYYGNDRVEAKAVGITGGAIGGAEIVMSVQAAFGVDKWWMYVVFPALGAGAGGVGGYYLEKASAPGAVALLVCAVAAIIPTAVLTTSAFAYDPEKEGAVKADTMEEGGYSFEKPPEESEASESTRTEVEAVPEIDPNTVGPPEPSGAEGTEPVDEVRGKEPDDFDRPAPADPEDPETETNTPKAPSPDAQKNEKDEPTSRRPTGRKKLHAAYRPSGTLLHIHRNGAVSLSLPYVDILPALGPSETSLPARSIRRPSGIEAHIPLVRVDLP